MPQGIGSGLEVDADGTRQELVAFNGQTSSAHASHSRHHNLFQAMANFGDDHFGLTHPKSPAGDVRGSASAEPGSRGPFVTPSSKASAAGSADCARHIR